MKMSVLLHSGVSHAGHTRACAKKCALQFAQKTSAEFVSPFTKKSSVLTWTTSDICLVLKALTTFQIVAPQLHFYTLKRKKSSRSLRVKFAKLRFPCKRNNFPKKAQCFNWQKKRSLLTIAVWTWRVLATYHQSIHSQPNADFVRRIVCFRVEWQKIFLAAINIHQCADATVHRFHLLLQIFSCKRDTVVPKFLLQFSCRNTKSNKNAN